MNNGENKGLPGKEEAAHGTDYPPQEDIYSQQKPVPIDAQGELLDDDEARIEEIEESLIGSDLDVPGAELDDFNEILGEEDEENNYYSLSDNNDDADD